MARKATVTIAGVPVAASGPVAWRFQTGAQPYTTTFSVHISQWERVLRHLLGQDVDLVIVDSRSVVRRFRHLTILHEVASDSPNRATFIVADRRWRWPYKHVERDFNVGRRTGDRSTDFESLPVETRLTFDEYDFYPYSLDGKRSWTARRAVEEVLQLITERSSRFRFDSFPIEGDGEVGELTLRDVRLNDPGDVALSRILSYAPGAEVYIDAKGVARVIDAADLKETEAYFKALPPSTWDGDSATFIDRRGIRPPKIRLHYLREFELLLEYADSYGTTVSTPDPDVAFVENVIPTVDPVTEVREWDPDVRGYVTKRLPPGSWVEATAWLRAMNDARPTLGGSPVGAAWTFDNIRAKWVEGDLDGLLGGGSADVDPDGNISRRVQALKEHFRQTFRVNRRIMQRLRSFKPIRAALLDPITGTRALAAVWGQACVVPNAKGIFMMGRKDSPIGGGVYRNLDFVRTPTSEPPGPQKLEVLDEELGIFRLSVVPSPYGTDASFVPCKCVDQNEQDRVPSGEFGEVDRRPPGMGMRKQFGVAGFFLARTFRWKAMVTVVAAAPNNERRLHRVEVSPEEVASVYRGRFDIKEGEGPTLDVFIPPSEVTARFGWRDDDTARRTVSELLGLGRDEEGNLKGPQEAGIDGMELPGFVLVNQEREIAGHSKAAAAEVIAAFADDVHGQVSTVMSEDEPLLRGSVDGLTFMVTPYPSAKVKVVHEFPGRQHPLSRFAFLPMAVRELILGIIPFRGKKS